MTTPREGSDDEGTVSGAQLQGRPVVATTEAQPGIEFGLKDVVTLYRVADVVSGQIEAVQAELIGKLHGFPVYHWRAMSMSDRDAFRWVHKFLWNREGPEPAEGVFFTMEAADEWLWAYRELCVFVAEWQRTQNPPTLPEGDDE